MYNKKKLVLNAQANTAKIPCAAQFSSVYDKLPLKIVLYNSKARAVLYWTWIYEMHRYVAQSQSQRF